MPTTPGPVRTAGVEGSAWGVVATPLGDSSTVEQGSADALAEQSSNDFWQADREEDSNAANPSTDTETSGDGSSSGSSSGSSIDTSISDSGSGSSLGKGAEGSQAPALGEQGSSEQQQLDGGSEQQQQQQEGDSPDHQQQQQDSSEQQQDSSEQQQPPGEERQQQQQEEEDWRALSRSTFLPLDKLQRQDGQGEQRPASPLAEEHRLTK